MGRLAAILIKGLEEASGIKTEKSFKRKLEMFYYTHPMFSYVHKITTFFNVQKERVIRLWAYGKQVWPYGEFDHNWHMQLWSFSLKRLYWIMKNGHCVFSKTAQRKMKTAIALLDRMTTPWESYHEPADAAFNKKWGFKDTYELVRHPTDPQRFYTSRHKFRDSLPPITQKVYDKEYSELLEIEDKMFKQDMELFCKILTKHFRSWWD